MNATFRTRKVYWIVAIARLLVWVYIIGWAVYDEVLRGWNIYAFCFLVALLGFGAGRVVLMLLAYLGESLAIKDATIIQTGIIRSRRLDFSEITDVHWRTRPTGGSVVLRSASQRIKVDLDNFGPKQGRRLIRLLRLSLSPSIQSGWERFCLRIALPLSQSTGHARITDDEAMAPLAAEEWDRLEKTDTGLDDGTRQALSPHGDRALLPILFFF
jgi:hypothetical protein